MSSRARRTWSASRPTGTVLWGFGLENIDDRAARAKLIGQGLKSLGVDPYTNAGGSGSGDRPGDARADARHPGDRSARSRPAWRRTYTASTTANVISTAGDAALTVSDPVHLINGSVALPSAAAVSLSKSTWDGPVLERARSRSPFAQRIGAGGFAAHRRLQQDRHAHALDHQPGSSTRPEGV